MAAGNMAVGLKRSNESFMATPVNESLCEASFNSFSLLQELSRTDADQSLEILDPIDRDVSEDEAVDAETNERAETSKPDLHILVLLGGVAGGICAKATTFRDGKKKSLNTGVVTFQRYNRKVPKRVSEIAFAHETGHSFGSSNDFTPECVPGESEGNYIMFTKLFSREQTRNNRLFSPCSRRQMNAVMNTKGRCIDSDCCFKDIQGALCGNMVVEKGEECDCGYAEDESCKKDICCEGRNRLSGCKRLPGKACSPSQGLCCSDDCSFRNTFFLCQNATECTNSSYCDGIEAACPSKPKADLTECNGGRQTCLSGECSGSICLKYGLLGCQCKQKDHLCDVCCKDGQKGECRPTKDIPSMRDTVKNLKVLPGAPCNDSRGECDVFLKCSRPARKIFNVSYPNHFVPRLCYACHDFPTIHDRCLIPRIETCSQQCMEIWYQLNGTKGYMSGCAAEDVCHQNDFCNAFVIPMWLAEFQPCEGRCCDTNLCNTGKTSTDSAVPSSPSNQGNHAILHKAWPFVIVIILSIFVYLIT